MGCEREAQQVAESQILGQDHEAFRLGVLKDRFVRPPPQTDVANIFNFKALSAKQRCQRSRQIFVDENARVLPHRSNLFVANGPRGVGERCKHILTEELIFLHNLLDGHSTGELSDDKVDRHTGTGDNRLSEPNLLVHGDSRCDLGHAGLTSPRSRFEAPGVGRVSESGTDIFSG